MKLALKYLKDRESDLCLAKSIKERQDKRRQEIKQMNLDVHAECYKIAREVGDPMFYNEEQHKSIIKAIDVLERFMNNIATNSG